MLKGLKPTCVCRVASITFAVETFAHTVSMLQTMTLRLLWQYDFPCTWETRRASWHQGVLDHYHWLCTPVWFFTAMRGYARDEVLIRQRSPDKVFQHVIHGTSRQVTSQQSMSYVWIYIMNSTEHSQRRERSWCSDLRYQEQVHCTARDFQFWLSRPRTVQTGQGKCNPTIFVMQL